MSRGRGVYASRSGNGSGARRIQHRRDSRPPRRPQAPESRFQASKRLIYGENQNFSTRYGVTPLIHNLDRVTLWTTPIFPDGSNALVTGYFLRTFFGELFLRPAGNLVRVTAPAFPRSQLLRRTEDAEGARGADRTAAPRATRRRAARCDRPVCRWVIGKCARIAAVAPLKPL
jgi:hypothetical protein